MTGNQNKRHWMFAYGALLDSRVVGERLGWPRWHSGKAVPCRLDGWARVWNFSPPLRFLRERGNGKTLVPVDPKQKGYPTFLNLQPKSGATVQGIAWKVTSDELEKLDDIEVADLMHRVDITHRVHPLPERSACVHAFVATAEPVELNTRLREAGEAVIPHHYYTKCRDALEAIVSDPPDILDGCDLEVVRMHWK